MKRDRFVRLVDTIFAVREEELSCSEYFASLPQYVDLELQGQDPAARLPEVCHHIHQCPECEEVYRALLDTVAQKSGPEG